MRDSTAESEGGKAHDRPHHRLRIALGVFGGLIGLTYLVGVLVFSFIYYPHTSIAGVDVSLATKDAASERIGKAAAAYRLHINGEGFSWTYTPPKGSDLLDASKRSSDVLATNTPFAWPWRLGKALLKVEQARANTLDPTTEAAPLPASFNNEAFQKELNQAIDAYNEDRTGEFNAQSAFDPQTATFSSTKALSNAKLDQNRISELARTALSNLIDSVEIDESCFLSFANRSSKEEIETACATATKLVSSHITLTMAGNEVAKIEPQQLATWVSFDEHLTPHLDSKALQDWVRTYTTDSLDTVGSERSYTRPDGKQITISGGTFGWIVDSAEAARLVAEAVQAGGDKTLELPLKREADTFAGKGQRDWGSWLDVDISEQHAYLYDSAGSLLWESGIITGNPNQRNATPTGIYSINNLARHVTLIGKKDPETGEPIYRTPVDYWMPFVGGAIGFHDATWQASSSFSNPDAYYYVGSHGCVNLPYAKAEELYGLISAGLCVIVHY
ncbi:L,D-transpeptidase/peptidoglycan binding protein [Collinsella sp. AGMB00827]|uniref:L,D-transpeptidase/peptidoglycan binding protein n=1 Tax=Collinsella ureilytica TaxID=2869515 RepID=A0ABS7MHT3_9ACTN|nr:L,D-transpeptidase family protein [Collinsella urealyticum]MBY4796847.1 L,D-transpeptidase/peptidoglycan binding protein [Collinsella urealyticum]